MDLFLYLSLSKLARNDQKNINKLKFIYFKKNIYIYLYLYLYIYYRSLILIKKKNKNKNKYEAPKIKYISLV